MHLTIKNISKRYGTREVLLQVNLQLQAMSTMSVLGKSGCGKSTLLKLIAGLEKPDSGNILLNDVDVTRKKPNARNIVYLFQEPLLFPHLNVYENVAFGLRARKETDSGIRRKVTGLLEQLGIAGEANKRPGEISGGQKQRVAFGRAIVINPPLLLLDEPFSNLDFETRAGMQQLYKNIAASYQITALFVTHDLKEALVMGDSIAYMENGSLAIYKDREAFISDRKTGVQGEIEFWNGLGVNG